MSLGKGGGGGEGGRVPNKMKWGKGVFTSKANNRAIFIVPLPFLAYFHFSDALIFLLFVLENVGLIRTEVFVVSG